MTNLMAIARIVAGIAMAESGGNPAASGPTGREAGVLQERPCYVREANRTAGTAYRPSDAYDPVRAGRIAGLRIAQLERRLGRTPTAREITDMHRTGSGRASPGYRAAAERYGRQWETLPAACRAAGIAAAETAAGGGY